MKHLLPISKGNKLMSVANKTKVMFVVTEDWYFYSHRLLLALRLKELGYDVLLATKVSKYEEQISHLGIHVFPLKRLRRSSLNPFSELMSLVELYIVLRKVRPDFLHLVAFKPVVHGCIVAKLLGIKKVINALGGLGSLFVSRGSMFARFLKFGLLFLCRILLNQSGFRVIVQNTHDLDILQKRAKIKSSHLILIPSVGVDTHRFSSTKIQATVPTAILASRMLWEKGIGEFVLAASELKSEGLDARFILIGEPDIENPSSICIRQLKSWDNQGVVEWWGFQPNIAKMFSECWAVCLPSYYGEGVPKVLIEAMSSSRPIVTTKMPGCEDLIPLNGENGILVEPKNVGSLKIALKKLLTNKKLCSEMGKRGRKLAIEKYESTKIINQTISVYIEL